jgi:hypothetical protein
MAAVWFNVKDGHKASTIGSAAFSGGGVADPLAEPTVEELVELVANNRFQFVAPEGGELIRLRFWYRCETVCPTLWLKLGNGEEEITAGLVRHSLLEHLPWFYIEDGDRRLYQREMKYRTVESFLSANEAQAITDKELAAARALEGVDYILTTYAEPQMAGSWYRYDQVAAIPPEFGGREIYWKLQFPELTRVTLAKVEMEME